MNDDGGLLWTTAAWLGDAVALLWDGSHPPARRADGKHTKDHEGHDEHEGGEMLRVTTPLSDEEEAIVSECLGCGIAVHRELGPGFKEIIYHRAFALEAGSRGLRLEKEKRIEVKFKQWLIPGQKVDLIVEGVVLVEIKTVPKLKSLHRDQVRSYLKTTGLKVGLLLNFNSYRLKDQVKRVVADDHRRTAGRIGVRISSCSSWSSWGFVCRRRRVSA